MRKYKEKNLIDLEDKLYKVYLEYAEEILKMRGEDKEEWGLEASCYGVHFSDMCLLGVNEMGRIIEYGIPATIVYEWRDMRIDQHRSERVKKHYDQIKDYNLITFYRFFHDPKNRDSIQEEVPSSNLSSK